jgi:hypothetical protein
MEKNKKWQYLITLSLLSIQIVILAFIIIFRVYAASVVIRSSSLNCSYRIRMFQPNWPSSGVQVEYEHGNCYRGYLLSCRFTAAILVFSFFVISECSLKKELRGRSSCHETYTPEDGQLVRNMWCMFPIKREEVNKSGSYKQTKNVQWNVDLSFPDISSSLTHQSISVVPEQIQYYIGTRIYRFPVYIVLFQDARRKR